MSSVLPKSIDYRELPNSLSSNISSTTQILNPVNSKSTYTTAVAPPIHFRRKLPLPTRYEIRTTVWYDIIRQVFSRSVESSMFKTLPALLIRTLRKPPTHTWLRRACSRTCIHFKFNHVSTSRRHRPKEYYRGCTLFSVHSSAEIAMHKGVMLTLFMRTIIFRIQRYANPF